MVVIFCFQLEMGNSKRRGTKGKQVARYGGRPSKKRKRLPVMRSPKGKGKGSTSTKAPTPYFPERWAIFGNRKIWPERGINLDIFGATWILETVNTMGWRGFVRTPNKAALELVREFYFAMPEQFYKGMPVIVQGKEVLITATKINKWFDTVDDLDQLVEGLPMHEFFEPFNGQLAADLRIDGSPLWNDYRFPLLYNELKIETAFWYLFFSFSLVPTTHRTQVSCEDARYIFCAKNLILMDVGQIIMKRMFEAGKSTVGPLPFPCLVTHFCEEAGIDVHGGGWTMISPTGNLGKRGYNDIARRRGLPPLVIPRGVNEDDIDDFSKEDEDYNEQNLGDDPDTEGRDQGSALNQILQTLKGLRVQMDANQQANVTEFAILNHRMDAFQKALVDFGCHIPYVRGQTSGLENTPQQADHDTTSPLSNP